MFERAWHDAQSRVVARLSVSSECVNTAERCNCCLAAFFLRSNLTATRRKTNGGVPLRRPISNFQFQSPWHDAQKFHSSTQRSLTWHLTSFWGNYSAP